MGALRPGEGARRRPAAGRADVPATGAAGPARRAGGACSPVAERLQPPPRVASPRQGAIRLPSCRRFRLLRASISAAGYRNTATEPPSSLQQQSVRSLLRVAALRLPARLGPRRALWRRCLGDGVLHLRAVLSKHYLKQLNALVYDRWS
ncbi:hypothetical protein U9M48_004715 [Paspalum notatum var. saurae]|uniref:Uncharacterized protein n=1 Tax=Paspalum notatum var. saurae TaxID=547442 RepID=A0AAQ3PNJ3_PASNO